MCSRARRIGVLFYGVGLDVSKELTKKLSNNNALILKSDPAPGTPASPGQATSTLPRPTV
jgi:hypothetical protein